jgi:hypothetical protein
MAFDRDLGSLTIMLNGKEEFLDPATDLYIEEGALNTEFCEQASKFAFYGGIHSDCYIELESRKRALSSYEAEIELDIRQKVSENLGQGERMSEAKIEAALKREPKWQEISSSVLQMQAIVGKLDVWKDAFKQRSQMLFNLGATKRQEMMRLTPNTHDEE